MDDRNAYKILFHGMADALTEFDRANDENPQMIRAEMRSQNAQRQTETMSIEAEQEVTWQKMKTG